MFAEVISDDSEIKDYYYEPLKSGSLYKAAFESKYYTRVFFYIDGEEYYIVVHNRHLRILEIDEARDFKLKKILMK